MTQEMASFTIDLTDAAVARLQALVSRYNADNGAALSVQDWITLHLRELAVQDELLSQVQSIQRQKEQEALAGIAAAKEELLRGV